MELEVLQIQLLLLPAGMGDELHVHFGWEMRVNEGDQALLIGEVEHHQESLVLVPDPKVGEDRWVRALHQVKVAVQKGAFLRSKLAQFLEEAQDGPLVALLGLEKEKHRRKSTVF